MPCEEKYGYILKCSPEFFSSEITVGTDLNSISKCKKRNINGKHGSKD